MLSADVPSGIWSLTLAPCSNRNLTVSYAVVAHGEEQRRVAALGALVQLRAEFEQQLGGVRVAFARGEHQRRLPAEGFRQADLRAAPQQRAHGSDAAVARRGHERRLSFF